MGQRVLAALLTGAVAVAAVPVSAQTVRVSVATDGTEANSNSVLPATAGTGRFVAFTSFASNLVAGDTNAVEDVFLRDRDTDDDGTFDEPGAVSTVRVSQRAGVQGNGPSSEAAITPDGRYVVFTSFASNLFTNGQPALAVSVVLRWDRQTGDIVLVSQTTAGEPLLAVRSVDPDVSDDGNQVVFVYGGTLQAESDAGFRGVIYRRDIAAGTLTQVSTVPLADGAVFKEHNVSPSISGDGLTIAYGVESKSALQGKLYGVAYVVDAATNAVRAQQAGVQPRLSKEGTFLAYIDAQGENDQGPLVRLHLASGTRISTGLTGINANRVTLSPSGRYYQDAGQLIDFRFGTFVTLPSTEPGSIPGTDLSMAIVVDNFVPNRPVLDVVVASFDTLLDRDGDSLNDHWEGVFGLSTDVSTGGTGVNGASGDGDNDGLTNAEEQFNGTHPLGSETHFLAEGAANAFFTTRFAIANPGSVQANVSVRYQLDGGGWVRRTLWVPAGRRVTLDSRAEGLGQASFSTVVGSNTPIVVDRLMTWGDALGIPYGSHAETSSRSPGTAWFLAEGSTVLGFQLFYLLQNPQATPTTATIRYLLPSGAPIVRTYELPAQSRTTVYVNTVPGLESTDVSADITATQPIAVERAMYRSDASQAFALGHGAAAVAQSSTSWFFGEGATGGFFDTYLLLANPGSTPATVTVDYLRDGAGAVTRTYPVPANSRFSVYVDGEPGMAATNFGTRVTSTVPIVAERAMYWAGGFFEYYEGHVSTGVTQTGSRWVLAEGERGGAYGAQSFVLIVNTAATPVSVRVRSLPESGAPATSEVIQIPAQTRLTYLPAVDSRGGFEVAEEGTSTGGLVVEGAIYWNAAGRLFGTGANWVGTRVP